MGTLVFVGAGLGGAPSMSFEAIEAIRKSDTVFLETYTTFVEPSFVADIGKMTGKQVMNVGRAEVEKGEALLSAAERGTASLIVGGESMSATTHASLRLEAARRGIGTKVIFGPSIFTAAPSLLGLHQYKFGRTVSIPRFGPNFRPISPFELIEYNMRERAHTLALLDVDAEHGYFMSPGEAFDEITGYGRERGSDILTDNAFACTVSRAGRPDCLVLSGRIGRLKLADFGMPPHCIVIPARLHFQEAEALMAFAGADRRDIEGLVD